MPGDLNMDVHQLLFLKDLTQSHNAATKGYVDSKLSLLGGDLQGGTGMGGNRISHLGEPEQESDAVRLRFVNEYFQRRDGASWMRNDLSLGGHKVTGMSNPEADQDGVNKRTLEDMMQAQQLFNEEHYIADDHNNNLKGPVGFNGQRLLNVGYPQLETDAADLRTVLYEISQNNLKKLTKYLRLEGTSEPTYNITMSDQRIKNLGSPTIPKGAANKKYVDDMIAAGPSTSTGGTAKVNADINANKFKIINLKNPTDPQDAVNHKFCQTRARR